MAIEDRIRAVVEPVIDDLELELVDLVWGGDRLRITIDHADGLGTERLTRATRQISHELDLADPVSAAYTLEVSSPGVERPLRTPAHFLRSVGEQVAIKLRPNDDGLRRVRGELTSADDTTIVVTNDDGAHTIALDAIAKARTVFDWGPPAKPGKGAKSKGAKSKGAKSKGAKSKGAGSTGAGSNKGAKDPNDGSEGAASSKARKVKS